MGHREADARAITKALLLGGAAAVRRVRSDVYAVPSASRAGVAHSVAVDGDGAYRCDCAAGRHGRVCWHQAAVYVARVERASGGRVTQASSAAPGARSRTARLAA